MKAEDYDLIVIPAGRRRTISARGGMIKLVRDAAAKKIPMAAICHGPWMLCSTDASAAGGAPATCRSSTM